MLSALLMITAVPQVVSLKGAGRGVIVCRLAWMHWRMHNHRACLRGIFAASTLRLACVLTNLGTLAYRKIVRLCLYVHLPMPVSLAWVWIATMQHSRGEAFAVFVLVPMLKLTDVVILLLCLQTRPQMMKAICRKGGRKVSPSSPSCHTFTPCQLPPALCCSALPCLCLALYCLGLLYLARVS